MKTYDTVIIGAGPAGMGCAVSLIKSGKTPCVIDKAVFPRNKTCAGLVTAKTERLIRQLLSDDHYDDVFCNSADSIKLFQKSSELVEAPLSRPVHLVDRIDFDNALVDRYKSLGGTILEGERGFSVDYDNNRVTLSDGSEIGYNTIVFADGALSMAHKNLKVDKGRMALGIEAYVPSDRTDINSVNIYFDYLKDGYMWAFPHSDTVCFGAANLFKKGVDYKALFIGFLNDLGVDYSGVKFIGAFLPYGYIVPQEKLPRNVILVGDAAGFADPISGEGLYMALQSGIYAAEAMQTDDPKNSYLKKVKPIIETVKDGAKVQKLFFSTAVQKTFLNKVKGKKGLVSYFFENQVDEYKYAYRDIRKLYGDYKNRNK